MQYEAPEMIEIGSAKALVLGGLGINLDCCNCSTKQQNLLPEDDFQSED